MGVIGNDRASGVPRKYLAAAIWVSGSLRLIFEPDKKLRLTKVTISPVSETVNAYVGLRGDEKEKPMFRVRVHYVGTFCQPTNREWLVKYVNAAMEKAGIIYQLDENV